MTRKINIHLYFEDVYYGDVIAEVDERMSKEEIQMALKRLLESEGIDGDIRTGDPN
jgi:hypothetical protein